MGFKVASLWNAPEINSVNHKARSIPFLNPFNVYGRVFFLSWWGFLIAFWSWYAFPPLMTVTIKKDLRLSQTDVANSNILSMTATLLVRLTAGAACDRIGPRWTFIAILLAGAIPTALAGTVTDVKGLLTLRFFVGILGGSFIPCQVWTTGFFDKNVVGTANALAAGLGNAGSGITYFVMPAVFDSLVQRQGLTERVAWRVTFIVPFILITATAVLMIITCPDTPTGKWSERRLALDHQLTARDVYLTTGADDKNVRAEARSRAASDDSIRFKGAENGGQHHEAQVDDQDVLNAASWELVEKPTARVSSNAVLSLPTLTLLATYFCSFGAELCINSILGAYYLKRFPKLGQTGSGNWAAMFGLLNAIFRPAGGMMSDLIYRSTRSLWGKKILIHLLGVAMGVFLLGIGFTDPGTEALMFGLMTGFAFFLEASNGACFSLVPHVHPTSNGIMTGVTGAAGNLGGIVFLCISRYTGVDYAKLFWIIGVFCISVNVLVAGIRPIPKGQLGGR
ncbi:MAG: hypothetical protein M1825_000950 [Sarcosagium campestre]|nr:MAG: hypothetical protein M1825_000950 [Sarcosagium campestre]